MNLRDHPHVRGGMAIVDVDSDDTGDDIALANPQYMATLYHDFEKQKGGHLSWNFVDTIIKYRPCESEAKAFGPGFDKCWKENFVGKPGKALISLLSFMMYVPLHLYRK